MSCGSCNGYLVAAGVGLGVGFGVGVAVSAGLSTTMVGAGALTLGLSASLVKKILQSSTSCCKTGARRMKQAAQVLIYDVPTPAPELARAETRLQEHIEHFRMVKGNAETKLKKLETLAERVKGIKFRPKQEQNALLGEIQTTIGVSGTATRSQVSSNGTFFQ